MREFIRPVAITLGIVCLSASMAVLSTPDALAQAMQKTAPAQAAPPAGQPPAVKQIALTDKQVDGVIAAAKDMDALSEKMPESGKPDPKLSAQLEATAKKYGFASYTYDTGSDFIKSASARYAESRLYLCVHGNQFTCNPSAPHWVRCRH